MKMVMALLLLMPSQAAPAERLIHREIIPLGVIRVTKYTHHEGGRWTSTGHRLADKDEGKVCAISREWWRKKVKPGDIVFIEGYAKECIALDTMAKKNRKGFRQRKWIDIYNGGKVQESLDFGIKKAKAYVVREK